MNNLLNNLAYLSSLALLGTLAIICLLILLLWLFIKSAVANGTKQGILEAYDILSGNKQKRINDDIENEINGWK